MPVVNSGTPTVNVSVPVPAPVQQRPRRPPVSFGGESDGVPPQQPMGPTGVPPQTPPKRRLSAVILPWSPPPKSQPQQMQRGVVRYSIQEHRVFQKAINAGDLNAAKVYADFLEEKGHHGNEETLHNLRNSTRPLWVSVGPDGKVYSGRRWTMAEIRSHMNAAGSHWFDSASNRFFGTRFHGEPVHGPNGTYFVTSETPSHSGRRYTVRSFNPGAAEIGEQVTEGYTPRGPNIATFELARHPTAAVARVIARRLAFDQPVDRGSNAQMNGDFTGVPDVRSKPTEPPSQLQRRVVKYAAPISAVNPGETSHAALTRFLGNRNRRAHGRSAYVHRLPNGDIGVTLHGTQIVTAHQNGQVTMNHGGYTTPTTRRFMSGYSGIPVSFAGGRFTVRNPQSGNWEEYQNNTRYPPDEQSSFEEAIRNEPTEATHHEVYADWLDEHQRSDEARRHRERADRLRNPAQMRRLPRRVVRYSATPTPRVS